MGGQLVFDWDRLEDFVIAHYRPLGTQSQIQYHMPKLSSTRANMGVREGILLGGGKNLP